METTRTEDAGPAAVQTFICPDNGATAARAAFQTPPSKASCCAVCSVGGLHLAETKSLHGLSPRNDWLDALVAARSRGSTRHSYPIPETCSERVFRHANDAMLQKEAVLHTRLSRLIVISRLSFLDSLSRGGGPGRRSHSPRYAWHTGSANGRLNRFHISFSQRLSHLIFASYLMYKLPPVAFRVFFASCSSTQIDRSAGSQADTTVTQPREVIPLGRRSKMEGKGQRPAAPQNNT